MARKITCFIVVFIVLLSCVSATAQRTDEENFFSYKKFFLNTNVLDSVKGTDLTRRNLKNFAFHFTEAVHFLTIGREDAAREELYKARRLWPEYFGTDFLLAISYENSGDFQTAARFYKRYLIKLKNYRDGNYPISGPIIEYLGEGRVEGYDDAKYYVRDRLARFGIDLDSVKPASAATGGFFIYLLALLFFIALYLVSFYIVIPYLRMQRRIKNPPEGFWVCKNCGASSPVLSKVCNGCGRPRE